MSLLFTWKWNQCQKTCWKTWLFDLFVTSCLECIFLVAQSLFFFFFWHTTKHKQKKSVTINIKKHHVVFTDRVVYTRNFHYFERLHSLDRCHQSLRPLNYTSEHLASIFDAGVWDLATATAIIHRYKFEKNKIEKTKFNQSRGLELAASELLENTYIRKSLTPP